MPLEILWADRLESFSYERFLEGTLQLVRFRKPQLIKVEDIISVFKEALVRLEFLANWSRSILVVKNNISKHEEKEPSMLVPGKKILSTKKSYSVPLKLHSPHRYGNSSIAVVHNVPADDHLIMGSCTWFNYTQPLTSIALRISDDWWHNKRRDKEGRGARQMSNDLYWFFQQWINHGGLVAALSRRDYDLVPRFDPSWTHCAIEDQCQECEQIIWSMPYRVGEVEVGEKSKNICNCRWRGNDKYGSSIERKFKIIGAYPISPEEAEVARCEGSLLADSID